MLLHDAEINFFWYHVEYEVLLGVCVCVSGFERE